MMNELVEWTISCPYCGERIEVVLDGSIPEQRYIEDCQVCCRPIYFDVSFQSDCGISVTVTSEDE